MLVLLLLFMLVLLLLFMLVLLSVEGCGSRKDELDDVVEMEELFDDAEFICATDDSFIGVEGVSCSDILRVITAISTSPTCIPSIGSISRSFDDLGEFNDELECWENTGVIKFACAWPPWIEPDPWPPTLSAPIMPTENRSIASDAAFEL
jgi:hypothetical protein